MDSLLPWTDVADELDALVSQSTADDEAELRDLFRVFSNLIWLVFTLAFILLIVLVARYVRLLRARFVKGDPRVLSQIRRLAWLQVWTQVGSLALVGLVFSGLETTNVAPSLGPGVVIGPVILFLTRRSDVRNFFSYYVLREAPSKPSIPAAEFFPATVEAPASKQS